MGGFADLASRLAERVAREGPRLAGEALDADRMLQRSMEALIELAGRRYPLDPGAQWRPGEPLRLMLVGYSGTRNTGADVRVEEMVRQLRHLFGDEQLDLTLLTKDLEGSRGYFRTVKQLEFPDVYPKFLFDRVHEQHGVVTCEGSMFKSKFANALSTFMAGALGLAGAEGKLAVGYGGEAGWMDPPMEDFVRRHVRDALVLARNDESVERLAELGIDARPGTDTAWPYEPPEPDAGARLLREAGWDGEKPVVALCPINAFWWPVRADLRRGVEHALTGAHGAAHYKSVYFHELSADDEERQQAYVDALAEGTRRALRGRDAFVVLVGMERLDRSACEALDRALGGGHPVVVSDEHDVGPMVSLLRHADAVLSSRYHGIVTCMPAGVPSAGVTMDERIRNLMADRGTPELALEVDDPELADRAAETLERLMGDGEALREGIERCVVANLERMGRMGMELMDYVRAELPDFPVRDELGGHGDPWDHLPALPEGVRALVGRHRPEALRDDREVA